MYVGSRKIRSAGRTSGSIEVTLPAQLQALEGLECRLVVREGPRPEIVLQPDFSSAQALFQELWQHLRLGLADVDDIQEFRLADFTHSLFPARQWQERPALAYADALVVLRCRPLAGTHAAEELARLLAGTAAAAGRRLGLRDRLALAFGDAVAYLMSGTSAGLSADFERGMAHQAFWGASSPAPCQALQADAWRQARAGLRQVYDAFQHWQDHPEAYAADRERWYRAVELELHGAGAAPPAELGRL